MPKPQNLPKSSAAGGKLTTVTLQPSEEEGAYYKSISGYLDRLGKSNDDKVAVDQAQARIFNAQAALHEQALVTEGTDAKIRRLREAMADDGLDQETRDDARRRYRELLGL